MNGAHVAHDQPESPLTYGTWLCDCRPCAIAVEAAARRYPALRLVVKLSAAPRVKITAAEYLAHRDRLAEQYGWPEHDDYVREVFVADPGEPTS